MLPLLTYKIFRNKRDNSMTSCNKSKIGSEQKTVMRYQCKCNKSKKTKKISRFELFILLFGMFGVPLSYILYSNTLHLYQWSVGDLNKSAGSMPTKISSDVESISLKLRSVISERMKHKHKYLFKHSWTEIDRRSELSPEEFHDMYSGKWPVIITDCVKNWAAFKKWDMKFFLENYGKELVTVKTSAEGIQETFLMPLSLYLSHIQEGYPQQWTYLNDEMFIPSRPTLEQDLGTCKELDEDFFELFPIEVRPWWAFLLWGTRYSRSDLHIDPFNWTGTNMVLSGLKRWKLFPPGQDHLLHVIPNQEYKFPLNFHKYNSYVDCFNNEDLKKYPSVGEAKVIEFYQYPGELLIIPTGWFHQAFNEEVTLAVSGQIMNRDNYMFILKELYKGGEIERGDEFTDSKKMDPKQQITRILSKIKKETLQKGREITLTIYDQVKSLAKSSGLPKPPLLFDRF